MQFLKMYIQKRLVCIFVFLLFTAIFLCAFFLYDLPLGAVIYPAVVCIVLGLIFLFFDIRRAATKHNKLLRLSHLTSSLMEDFPKIISQDDEDYQKIIEQLRQEQHKLRADVDKCYRDMTDYYTIWVHQIKTPIAAMRLILQGEDSAVCGQLLQELVRIEQYVQMVLVFLRLDSDSGDYVFAQTDLDSIIKESVKKFSGQFIRKKLFLNYSPCHISVLTDEKWLSFIIEQILSNALKYTQTGGITIEIEKPLTLCIRDTGIGIAPEDLPRVFEKSYTGYNGRKDKKASGLGLYLCNRICTNLGHSITINSSLDSGTVVKIHLEQQKMNVE